MSKITDSISKTSNEFSFISTFFDLVGNKEFKKAELSTMYTTSETAQTSIWRSLSAVAEKLGKEFYDSTLNFIDNIANIDLCKVNQLQSLVSTIGVSYNVFNNLKDMPVDVIKLLDLLSVKREYLTSYVKMNSNLVNNIISGGKFEDVGYVAGCQLPSTCSQLAEASCNAINSARDEWLVLDPQMSSYWSTVDAISCEVPLDDTAVDNYVSAAFYSLLSSKVQQDYNDKASTLVYKHLSDCILLSDFELPNSAASKIETYRKLFNIPISFDVEHEVDNYENGLSELSDYSSQELSLLNIEIDRRKEPYVQAQLKTRYKYYKEKEVQQYSNFIEHESKDDQQLSIFSDSKQYSIDSSYFELSEDDNASSLSSLYSMQTLREDLGTAEITCNLSVVATAAQKLATIASSIRQIREQLKYQCQKYFMYGTENLAKHIIQEYIKNNTCVVLKRIGQLDDNYVFDTDANTVSFIEYQDTTDYFNVSCAADEMLKQTAPADEIRSIKAPYWNSNIGTNAIGAFDTTDVFAQLPLLDLVNATFSKEQLSSLYVQTLGTKLHNANTHESDNALLPSFLTSLYSIGADSTFISDDIFHTYDSYELKQQLDSISTLHAHQIADIASQHRAFFAALSNDTLSSEATRLVASSTSLQSQLAALRDMFISCSNLQMIVQTSSLLSALSSAGELSDEVKLADAVSEISSKYYDIDLSWQEMYSQALETDSYEMQRQYDAFVEKCSSDWCALSVVYEQASSYIPDSFETQDLSLFQQLSAWHAALSSLSAAAERNMADALVTKLSSSIAAAGELSSVIGIDVLLETLSAQYENEAAEKLSELCLLRSSDLFKYREQVYQQYAGRSTSDTPWYYLKNTWHPSYMLHPCLCNFIEKTSYDYPIDNVINVSISSIAKELSSIDDYVDNDGYLINMQRNPLNTNQDYLSRYELLNKNGIDGIQSDIAAYDGLFYPPALHDFLNNTTYVGDLAKLSDDIADELRTVQGMSNDIIINCIEYYTTGVTGNKYTAVSFIDALSGITVCLSDYWCAISDNNDLSAYELLSDSICKITVDYDVTNPWYAALDLGKEDKAHIAKQLSELSTVLSDIAHNKKYDIFRYGLDAFKNSYCLVKDYSVSAPDTMPCDIDYDIRQQMSGKLWMRVKDHPIAFPLYLMDNKDVSSFADVAQLTTDIDCNQQYMKFKQSQLIDYNKINGNKYYKYYAPDIQDFTFNESRDKIVINGIYKDGRKTLNASYPVLVQASQEYSTRYSRMLYKHAKVDADNPTLALVSETQLKHSFRDYQLASYFSFDTKLGVIYSSINQNQSQDNNVWTCSVMIAGAYYDYSSNSNKTCTMSALVDVLSCSQQLENVCVDTCGDTVTVAYLDEVPKSLSNYISKNVDTQESKDSLDATLDVVVKTKKYTIGKDSFLECSQYGDYLSNEHSYIPYTDMGFYGLLGDSCKNRILSDGLAQTYLAQNDIEQRGIYKFQLLSEPVPSNDIGTMIDFQFMLPVRRYDSSEDISKCLEDKTSFSGKKYKVLSYLCAHYYEALADGTTSSLEDYSCLSSDVNVYDPASFMTMLQGYMPMVKIDESYLDTIDKTLLNEESLYSWPVLYYQSEDDSHDIPDIYQHPYKQTQATAKCHCSFQLLHDVPPLSVTWCKYKPSDGTEPAIKLDFNSLYYQSSNDYLSANSFNLLHLFLNLDKPGDAGILNIYENPLEGKYSKYVTYYIKNVSDSKPKFLLSAHSNVQTAYPAFICENSKDNSQTASISVLAMENRTTTAVAYEQAMLQLI